MSAPEPRPTGLTEGGLWLALLCTVLFGCLWDSLPVPPGESRIQVIPLEGPGFRGVDLPLVPAERETLGDAQALKRRYSLGSRSFLVLAVDGGRERHAIHSPETCLRGAGWAVVDRQPVPIPGGEAEEVTLVRGSQTRRALYWYSDGANRHRSFLRCRLTSALSRFTRGLLGGDPVLVVALTGTGEPSPWRELLDHLPALTRI